LNSIGGTVTERGVGDGSAGAGAAQKRSKSQAATKESFTKVRYRSEVPRGREQNARRNSGICE
jgi:hypothetical protein